MIEQCSLKLLEEAINRYIALSDKHREKLSEFNEKTIKLDIKPIHYYFFLRFDAQRILLEARSEVAADTTISAHPTGFIKMGLLPADKLRALFANEIEISGDVALGQAVKAFFETMEIDWEAYIARFSNDFIAQQAGRCISKTKQLGQELLQSFTYSITDMLQYDSDSLPMPEHIEAFCHDVDELRLRVDRLEARYQLNLQQTPTS